MNYANSGLSLATCGYIQTYPPVDPSALPAVDAGYDTLAELAPRPVEPGLAAAGVLLHALAAVEARRLADSALAAPPLHH